MVCGKALGAFGTCMSAVGVGAVAPAACIAATMFVNVAIDCCRPVMVAWRLAMFGVSLAAPLSLWVVLGGSEELVIVAAFRDLFGGVGGVGLSSPVRVGWARRLGGRRSLVGRVSVVAARFLGLPLVSITPVNNTVKV